MPSEVVWNEKLAKGLAAEVPVEVEVLGVVEVEEDAVVAGLAVTAAVVEVEVSAFAGAAEVLELLEVDALSEERTAANTTL